MRIHSLTITNFRAIEHLELKELPETGVIIVHGPNEAGKSTILEGIDLVLNERHSAKGKKIAKYAPANKDVGPEVELTATVGEVEFTVRKRWLKSAQAELTVRAPRRENFTGRNADDELARILDEHLDRTLMETLFLRQGELDPAVQAAGVPTIATALDAGESAGDSGVEDTQLMQDVDAEYAKYWTNAANPKPKAGFKKLATDVEQAREEYEARVAEVESLSRYVDEVARREEEIAQVDAELPGAEEALEKREQEAKAAEELAEKLGQANAKREQAAHERKRAAQDLEARTALAERVAVLRKEEADLRTSLEPAREAAGEEETQVTQLREELTKAKEAVAAARAEVKKAEQRRDFARATQRHATVEAHLKRVKEAEKAYREALDATPAKEITDADVRAAETAENEVALQRKLRDAASSKVELSGKDGTVTVDGETVEVQATESAEINVFDGTRIDIEGFQLTYRAAQGAQDPREAVREAEAALAELLEAAGCESVEELRDLRDAHKAQAAEVEAARRRREDVLAGADREELASEHERLAASIAELAEALGVDDKAESIDEADAENAVRDAHTALGAAEREAEQAEAALKPYAELKAAKALAVLEARVEAKATEAAGADKEFAAAEDAQPREALEAAHKEAEAALETATQEADTLAAAADEADVELAHTLLEAEQARVANMQQRKNEATIRITELRGRIEQATGAAEQADKAEARLEKAETELDKATRRAEAIKLLRTTLYACREEARAKYTAPFNAAIRKRARVIYGKDVDFNFGEGLQITDRSLGDVTVPLQSLSGGAKEQLALLTRFAIADLVTETGETAPVPVVVDDALGATDPERLALMNTLFTQAGKNAQVLVLTCFPQRFDRVAAAKTVHIDELKHADEQ